jgi:ADP-ribosylglycohydrolase
MVGLAVGDAIGYPVEFLRSKEAILAVTKGGVNGPPSPAIYTDDTQMTLCVARALLSRPADEQEFGARLASEFLCWLETQAQGSPHKRAPGSSCIAGCENLRRGLPWAESGVDSRGCGAAMRVAPIGLRFHSDMISAISYSRESSVPTHNNMTAMASASAAAMMVYLAANDVPPGLWAHEIQAPLGGICSLHPPGFDPMLGGVRTPGDAGPLADDLMDAIDMAVRCAASGMDSWEALSADYVGEAWEGHEAVASALFCVLCGKDDYAAAVLTAANSVGDSDTIACITGGIMGARLGIGAIPPDWAESIENREELLSVADALHDLAEGGDNG